MPHPDDDTLRLFASGRLDDEREEEIESHLAGCPDCTRRLTNLERNDPEPLLWDMQAALNDDSQAVTVSGTSMFNTTGSETETTGSEPLDGFLVGDRLGGNFRLEKQLGRGGMGIAWKAYDETAERFVVLKFVPKTIQHIVEAMHSVRESFKKVHALQHQHICPLYALHNDPQYGLYIVMKFIDGLPLDVYRRRYVEKHGAIPFNDTVQILWGVAKGLDYAHDRNVIHRDIKPQNVMIGKTDGVQIIDFGLAEEIRSSMLRHDELSVSKISGTRSYMAPEQWQGKTQDARTDQYALAVTAYELLAGHVPFYSKDSETLKNQVLHDLSEPIQGLPDSVNAALLKALSKKREDRYENCKAFVRALAAPSKNASNEGLGTINLPVDRLADDVSQPTWLPSQIDTSTTSVTKQRRIVPALIVAVFIALGLSGVLLWCWSNPSAMTNPVPNGTKHLADSSPVESIPTRKPGPVFSVIRMALDLGADGHGTYTVKRCMSSDLPDGFLGTKFPITAFPKAQAFRSGNGMGRVFFDFRDADSHSVWEKSGWKYWRSDAVIDPEYQTLRFSAKSGSEIVGLGIRKGVLPCRGCVELLDKSGYLPNICFNINTKRGKTMTVDGWGRVGESQRFFPGGNFDFPDGKRQPYVPLYTMTMLDKPYVKEFEVPKEILDDIDSVQFGVWTELRTRGATEDVFHLVFFDMSGRFIATIGMGIADRDGLPVAQRIVPNSPSERAGLREDDQIVHWNGRKRSVDEIRKIIENVKFGDPMEVEVVRNGKRLDFRFSAE